MSLEISVRMRNRSAQLTDCVRALFAIELLAPGRVLYLSAPQLQNTALLFNDLGQFGDLFRENETEVLTLADALNLLVERGVAIRLVHIGDESALDFVMRLAPRIKLRVDRQLAYPGVFTEQVCMRGAIQFGTEAVDLAQQNVRVEREPAVVNQTLLELEQYWEELNDFAL